MAWQKLSLREMARAAEGEIESWKDPQNPRLKGPLVMMMNSGI